MYTNIIYRHIVDLHTILYTNITLSVNYSKWQYIILCLQYFIYYRYNKIIDIFRSLHQLTINYLFIT